VIRDALPGDLEAIVAVTGAAFDDEGKAVRIVREVEPTVSLVYVEEDEVVGHVMLSPMRMDPLRPLQLSPLSVAPARQGRGVGSALVREALRRADELGEPFVLLLGHPGYYPRFGFEPAAPLGILATHDYGDAWMLAKLTAWDPAVQGTVEFPPAFD
jgi:putative acetyltransferase